MLREAGKIFTQAFRMIFQYPIFIYLPAAYYTYRLAFYFAENYASLQFLSIWKWVDIFLFTLFQFGVPVVFILIVLRSNEEIDLKSIIANARDFFLEIFRTVFRRTVFILYFSSAVSVFGLGSFFNGGIFFIASVLWFCILGFVGVGPITLGLRFLIDGGNGVFKNSMDGFRMLNGYFLLFITLYSVETLISLLNYSLRISVGSIFTGLELSSLSFSSLPAFTKSVSAFYETPAVYFVDIIFGPLFSFYNIVATLAYIRCKNHDSLFRAVRKPILAKN